MSHCLLVFLCHSLWYLNVRLTLLLLHCTSTCISLLFEVTYPPNETAALKFVTPLEVHAPLSGETTWNQCDPILSSNVFQHVFRCLGAAVPSVLDAVFSSPHPLKKIAGRPQSSPRALEHANLLRKETLRIFGGKSLSRWRGQHSSMYWGGGHGIASMCRSGRREIDMERR